LRDLNWRPLEIGRDVIKTGWAETKTETETSYVETETETGRVETETKTETSDVETEAETETSRVYQKFTNISTVEEAISC
jgi:hypothetical protein